MPYFHYECNQCNNNSNSAYLPAGMTHRRTCPSGFKVTLGWLRRNGSSIKDVLTMTGVTVSPLDLFSSLLFGLLQLPLNVEFRNSDGKVTWLLLTTVGIIGCSRNTSFTCNSSTLVLSSLLTLGKGILITKASSCLWSTCCVSWRVLSYFWFDVTCFRHANKPVAKASPQTTRMAIPTRDPRITKSDVLCSVDEFPSDISKNKYRN